MPHSSHNAETAPREEIAEFPLFPLSNLVFPGGVLPLRVFELRYTDMVTRVLRAESCFGICLLRSGREVGPGGVPRDVGTSVRIVDFDRLSDGSLGISVRGEQRFRIHSRRLRRDGLWVARVRFLEPEPVTALPEELQPLGHMLRDIHEQLGDAGMQEGAHYSDAGWVSGRLVELLPLSGDLKQSLLETADPLERLKRLRPAISRMSRAKPVRS